MISRLLSGLEFAAVQSTRTVLALASAPSYFSKPQRCPEIKDELLLLSAQDLAAKIRRGEVTSENVIKTYISRLNAVNPILNAIVEDRFEAALNDAKRVDDLLLTTRMTADEIEQKYPLLGLPLTVKESIAVEGCSHSGCLRHSNRKAEKDAPVVRMCKDAGAIPIALTNTPEMCVNFETYNKSTGVTNNPYDTRRTPGGSSGGEASLVSSAASVIGLGSDLYGSIRLPGHYCGVWGHKASSGLIPLEGHFPYCNDTDELWKLCFTMGPITRYAKDLSLLMQTIQQKPLINRKDIKIEDINIFYMKEDAISTLAHNVDKEIVEAIENLIKRLSIYKSCKQISITNFKKSKNYSLPLLINLIHYLHINIDDSNYIRECLRYVIGKSNYNFSTILVMLARQIPIGTLEKSASNCLKEITLLKDTICDTLGENGVLILPTHPTPANFHNKSYGKLDDYVWTGIFNFLGLPVTQCPLGLNSKGLPFGIQVVGTPNKDALTIAVAETIEKDLGGWIPPPY